MNMAKEKTHEKEGETEKDTQMVDSALSEQYCAMPACKRHGCKESEKDPECCNAHMFKGIVAIRDFLQKRNHTFGLMQGTLIGAKRGQGVIPWTADVDMYVDDAGIQALRTQKGLTEIPMNFFQADGMIRGCWNSPNLTVKTGWHMGGAIDRDTRDIGDKLAKLEQWKIDHHKSPGHDAKFLYYFDIYSAKNLGGFAKSGVSAVGQKRCEWKEMAGTATIYGEKFPAPANAEQCLEWNYGKTWTQGDKKTDEDGVYFPRTRDGEDDKNVEAARAALAKVAAADFVPDNTQY